MWNQLSLWFLWTKTNYGIAFLAQKMFCLHGRNGLKSLLPTWPRNFKYQQTSKKASKFLRKKYFICWKKKKQQSLCIRQCLKRLLVTYSSNSLYLDGWRSHDVSLKKRSILPQFSFKALWLELVKSVRNCYARYARSNSHSWVYFDSSINLWKAIKWPMSWIINLIMNVLRSASLKSRNSLW